MTAARPGSRRRAAATIRRSKTRLIAARDDLGRVAAGRGARNRDAYLAAIDGMVWGDGVAQGFVRGRSFLHPELRFAFDAPAGYAVANRPDAVIADRPAGGDC